MNYIRTLLARAILMGLFASWTPCLSIYAEMADIQIADEIGTSAVTQLIVLPEGFLVSGHEDGQIKIWNMERKNVIFQFPFQIDFRTIPNVFEKINKPFPSFDTNQYPVHLLCLHPKGDILAISSQEPLMDSVGIILFYSLDSQKQIGQFLVPGGPSHLFFNHDGSELFVGIDGILYVYSMDGILPNHSPTDIGITHDNELYQHPIKALEIYGTKKDQYRPDFGAILALPKEHIAYTGNLLYRPDFVRSMIHIIDLETKEIVDTLPYQYKGHIIHFAVNDSLNQLAVCYTDPSYLNTRVVLFDRTTKKIVRTILGLEKNLMGMYYQTNALPNAKADEPSLICLGVDGTIYPWLLESQILGKPIPMATNQPLCYHRMENQNSIIFGSRDQGISTLEYSPSLLDKSVEIKRSVYKAGFGPGGTIYDLAVSPNGEFFACASKLGVTIWRTYNRMMYYQIDKHANGGYRVAFNADGTMLATVGDKNSTIFFWNLIDRNESGILDGHSAFVQQITFSKGAHLFASGDSSGHIIILDTEKQKIVDELLTGEPIQFLSFNSEGDLIACGLGEGKSAIYNIPEKRFVKDFYVSKNKEIDFSEVNQILFLENDEFVLLNQSSATPFILDWNNNRRLDSIPYHADYLLLDKNQRMVYLKNQNFLHRYDLKEKRLVSTTLLTADRSYLMDMDQFGNNMVLSSAGSILLCAFDVH